MAKAKPRTGRPQEFDGTRLTVRLSAAQNAIAKKLGKGDASAGVRLALELAAKSKSANSPNSD